LIVLLYYSLASTKCQTEFTENIYLSISTPRPFIPVEEPSGTW